MLYNYFEFFFKIKLKKYIYYLCHNNNCTYRGIGIVSKYDDD